VSLVARRAGARFSVRGMSPELSSLVELLGLDEPLTPYDEEVRK
jgi:anti-anti-sigma regulatory factor